MLTKTILGILACAVLAGCAAPAVRLTYHSVPEGAAVIENGRMLGVTPVTIVYHPARAFYQGACVPVQPVTAQWNSGASAAWNGAICASNGYNLQHVFQRPDAPGIAVDAQAAAAAAYAQAAAASAQAQQDAQQEAFWDAAILNAPAETPLPAPPPPRYPASPRANLPVTAQPFSNPPVSCHLDPTGTTATCQ